MNKYRIIQIISLTVFIIAVGYIVYTKIQYKSAADSYSSLSKYISVKPDESIAIQVESTTTDIISEITTESEKAAETQSATNIEIINDEPELFINHSGLRQVNEEYIGWISACENNISYPVVLAEDNDKYLHTTFKGQKNFAGSVFMDYRCKRGFNSFSSILYGHSMIDWSMFRYIVEYTKENYAVTHPYFYIYTDEGRKKYTVFSVFESDESLFPIAETNASEKEKQAYFDNLKNKSIYNLNDISLNESSKIVLLMTCDVVNTTKRIVVCGICN